MQSVGDESYFSREKTRPSLLYMERYGGHVEDAFEGNNTAERETVQEVAAAVQMIDDKGLN